MLVGRRIEQSADLGKTRSKLRSVNAWKTAGRAQRESAFHGQMSELAQALAMDSSEDSSIGIGRALDFLLSGLGASMAAFYSPAPTRSGFSETPEIHFAQQAFRSIGGTADAKAGTMGASASQSSLHETLELSRLPDRGEALRAGQARRFFWPQAVVRPQLRGAAGAAQWQSASPLSHALLFIPCLGPTGLLGVFAVDGGLASRRGTPSVLTDATLIGTQVASLIERKRLEAELGSLQSLRAEGDRLETLGRVATSMAHDFNNVLTAIGGNAELLEMALPEDAKEQVEVREIAEATKRAADLVEEVVSFGRGLKKGTRRVNLAELVGRLTPITRRVAGGGMDVVVDLRTDLPSIELNPGRFERVLLNLASNARDAQPPERPGAGTLAISAQSVQLCAGRRPEASGSVGGWSYPTAGKRIASALPDGHYVRLRVEDDGDGMELSVQEKVFEPFFTTKAEGCGTGLGLATCAEVMRELGGAVIVESAPGEGTAFDLYFPVTH